MKPSLKAVNVLEPVYFAQSARRFIMAFAFLSVRISEFYTVKLSGHQHSNSADNCQPMLDPRGDVVQAEDAGAIAEAGLDAAAAVLQVAGAAGLPRQLVAEEALERVASLVRVQLVQNVYPFHDARLQRLLRPGLTTAGTCAVRVHVRCHCQGSCCCLYRRPWLRTLGFAVAGRFAGISESLLNVIGVHRHRD